MEHKYICENCGKEHDGSYGSGRFCSRNCSRSYNAKIGHKTRIANGTFVSNLHPETRRAEYGRWKCVICGEIFNTRRSMQNHRKITHGVKRGHAWNKGLTKETSSIVRSIADKNKISMLEKSHSQSKKTREILSEIRSKNIDSCGGFSDVGWYKVNNINNVEFTVRGHWEENVALKLNEHNVLWIRNQTLKYYKDGICKTYNPDFYLPVTNEYIEVKGYFSDNDKLKMKLVLKNNPTVRIYFIDQFKYNDFITGKITLSDDLLYGI